MAMPAVATFIATLTATFAMMMATATATTSQMLNHVLNFLFCRLAILNHATGKVQDLAGKRVVRIYGHTVFLYLLHLCHKALVFIVHQCNDGALEDILMVEMAVNHKNPTIHFMYALRLILAECFSRLKGKIER